MTQKSINQLQLWNLSSQLASTAYDVHAGNMTFKEFIDTHDTDFNLFDTESELIQLVEDTPGDTRKEVVNSLRRAINNALKEEVTLTTETLNINLTGLQLSNRARQTAKDLLDHVTESDKHDESTTSNTEAYETLLETHEELLPASETQAVKLVQALQGETRQEQFNELTSALVTRVTQNSNNQEESLTIEREIGEKLVTLFLDRDYGMHNSYFDISDQYTDIVFPSRDVAMMNVMNATGSTRQKRVESIVEWVATWVSNPEHAKELSSRRLSPMGMPGRSD